MTGYNKKGYYGGYPNEGVILMQVTGLKDKNGIEIYEGDVWEIKFKDPLEGLITKRHLVEYKDGYLKRFKYDIGEIIGNIYENPELLK